MGASVRAQSLATKVFDGVTLAEDRVATLNCSGFNQLTLYCTYLHQDTISALSLKVAGLSNMIGGTDYYKYIEEDTVAPVVGVNIVAGRSYNLLAATPVDNTTYRFKLHIPIDDDKVQITLDETGNEATALFTCWARLSVQ
jgi:hypothetical protein